MSTTTNSCQAMLKSMSWCQGKSSKAGLRRRAYAILPSQIIGWPKYDRDDNGHIKSSVLKGNFTLAEGAFWQPVDHLPAKSSYKSTTEGEFPSQVFKVEASLVHPGVGEEAADATAALLNSNAIFLVEVMEGRFRLLGSEDYDNEVKSERDQGQGPTGATATTINVTSYMEVDSPYYDGKIETEDGTINAPAGN